MDGPGASTPRTACHTVTVDGFGGIEYPLDKAATYCGVTSSSYYDCENACPQPTPDHCHLTSGTTPDGGACGVSVKTFTTRCY